MTDPAVPKTPLSPKTIVAGIAAFLIPGALAVLGYLQANGENLFVALPPVLVVAIMAVIPGVIVFLSSYQATDPLRYHPTPQPIAPADPADTEVDGPPAGN